MVYFRSFLFHFLFYLNIIIQIIVWAPVYFFIPRKIALYAPRFWASSCLWLHDFVIGTRREISGLQNLPSGSFIVASKHQSAWDVLLLIALLPDSLFILKHHLFKIPVFGCYMMKMRMIPIRREKAVRALKDILALSKKELSDEERQLVIYPEGTRRMPGAAPLYKSGVIALYAELGLPVVPVAHQAGLFWPRRKFERFPGTIRVHFMPAIEPGLSKKDFMNRLIAEIEESCDLILVKTSHDPIVPPFPKEGRIRLAKLNKDN